MLTKFGIIVAALGFIMAIMEAWRPDISSNLEKYINSIITSLKDFQEIYRARRKNLESRASEVFAELAKGPQLKTLEEHTSSIYTSIENIRDFLFFYISTTVNFLFFIPFHSALIYLNKIGKGRAVTGIGIVIAAAGLLLACIA